MYIIDLYCVYIELNPKFQYILLSFQYQTDSDTFKLRLYISLSNSFISNINITFYTPYLIQYLHTFLLAHGSSTFLFFHTYFLTLSLLCINSLPYTYFHLTNAYEISQPFSLSISSLHMFKLSLKFKLFFFHSLHDSKSSPDISIHYYIYPHNAMSPYNSVVPICCSYSCCIVMFHLHTSVVFTHFL